MLSERLFALYRFFFVPLSRRNEPIITKFDTAAAARISADAQTVRYCCNPRLSMTIGTLVAVIAIRMIDKLNSELSWNFLFQVCPELNIIGIGNATSRISVIISHVPIVIKLPYP